MTKTVLFVPGYQEDETSRDYATVMKQFRAAGYHVRFVPINWRRTTVVDWAEELEAVYAEYEAEEVILAGFSYGAMTVFTVAARCNPSELWLFSLSPYFREDIRGLRVRLSWLKAIGVRRTAAFETLHFRELATKVHCKTHLFIGAAEAEKWPVTAKRSEEAKESIKNSTFTVVPDTGHDVAAAPYVRAIRDVLGE